MRLPDMDFDPRDYRAAFLKAASEVVDRRRRASGPRVGGAIGRKQARAVDSGIDLRGGQRGMAEQVLDGSQVASPSQKMRGERMAKRVRRRAFGQAERAAHPRHRQLHDAWRQGPAFRADEQWASGRKRKGAKRQIVLYRLANWRNDRRRARLLALADD